MSTFSRLKETHNPVIYRKTLIYGNIKNFIFRQCFYHYGLFIPRSFYTILCKYAFIHIFLLFTSIYKVVHGYVGNKCATFAIQTHGIDADAINTVQLSNNTGNISRFIPIYMDDLHYSSLFRLERKSN